MTSSTPWGPGRLLKTARAERGLSQRQAAAASGLSQAYYRWIEEGTRLNNGTYEQVRPSSAALRQAAQGAGADPDAVVSAAGLDPTEQDREELHELVDALPSAAVRPALAVVRELSRL